MFSVLKDVLKLFIIRLILNCVAFLHLDKVFPKAAGQGVIFTLHHVRPRARRAFNPNALLEVTPEFLEDAILTAKQAGLEPVRLEDLPELLSGPDKTRKFVCFTLDDGNRDNAEFAAPVFRKHGIPFTIFVCPGLTTRSRTMWWETAAEILDKASAFSFDFGSGIELLKTQSWFSKQVAFLKLTRFVLTVDEDEAVRRIDALALSLGVDPVGIVDREIMTHSELSSLIGEPLLTLGGHTMTHPNLARVSQERLAFEIAQSCKVVGGVTNKKTSSFAYPYGGASAVGLREAEMAKSMGLKVAVTTQPGVLSAASLDTLTALKRISLNGLYQKQRYVRALISGVPFWLV
jgi:peptidoglycan/xylan/chitin deacetylase (PgdA/CDA1 family)